MSKRRSVPGGAKSYPMQYHASRVTGKMSGGCFWNPPQDCTGRILNYHNERWVQVWTCRTCKLLKVCEARHVSTKVPAEEMDTPQNRRMRNTQGRGGVGGRRRS